MIKREWLKARCPICGKEYEYLSNYKPATCGRFNCLKEANKRGILPTRNLAPQKEIGEIFKEIEQGKMYHYGLVHGTRKEDTYSILLSQDQWEFIKSKHLGGENG